MAAKNKYHSNLANATGISPRIKSHLISLYDKNIYSEKEFDTASLPISFSSVNKRLNNASVDTQQQKRALGREDRFIERIRNRFDVEQKEQIDKCCCAMRNLSLHDRKNNRCEEIDQCCVSEHDRKIISRLAIKRVRQLNDIERAEKARELWEAERELRDQMLERQTNLYKAQLEEKRIQEKNERKRRERQSIKLRKRQESQMRYEMQLKNANFEEKLKILELQKGIEINKRRQEMQTRNETNALNLQAKRVEQTLRKCEIADNLEAKQTLAAARREDYMKEYETRLASANKEWAQIRDCGLQLVQIREQNRLERLQQSAVLKHERYEEAKNRRLIRQQQALDQARRSAEIRESVRTQTPETTRRQIKNLLNRHCVMTDDEFEYFN